MICREFKHSAASLTLWELSRPRDEQMLDHADECPKCGAWLDKQQVLAATMQTLQARTVGCEAGPHVERALLRMFRQVPFEATQPVVAHRSAPIAWRLSRFFEVGAYVAVAAAIVVGLFLGVRLLEQPSGTGSIRAQSAQVNATPGLPTQVAGNAVQKEEVAPRTQEAPATSVKHDLATQSVARDVRTRQPRSVAPSLNSDDPEYVALMFCDPLSCSSDAQVVRMELPQAGAAGDRDAQPLVADVVVGYDGVVRAMRIVN